MNNAESIKINAQNNAPLVSVAVITYNQLSFLKECIDSIIGQNYSNIEIVIADDCSTDGTREWLTSLECTSKSNIVLSLAEKNEGVTANSNRALSACSGKYICWMGGDDLMLPEKIALQVEAMERHPDWNISYHDLDVFESTTNRTLYFFSQKDKPRQGGVRETIRYGAFNGACSTMTRASASPDHGFDIRISIASDWLFWMQTLGSNGKIGYIDKVLGRYRRHDENVTAKKADGPSFKNLQDHLLSCAIILSEYPEYTRSARHIVAAIFRSMRLCNSGKNYAKYLVASLQSAFSAKAIFGLLIYFVSGRKL